MTRLLTVVNDPCPKTWATGPPASSPRQREISIISWMEILIGAETSEEEKACREFLSTFTIHHLSVEIATEAVQLRKQFEVRLPDAIVWATARANSCLLVTRNSRDFPATEPGVRIPYSAP